MRPQFKMSKENIRETAKLAAIMLSKKGAVIVYPTETSYGIGCRWKDKKAIEKIYVLKNRPVEKKFPAIVANKNMLKKFFKVPKRLEGVLCDLMPGPLSLILGEKGTGNKTCVRATSSQFAAYLSYFCRCPLIATSANLSGKPNAYSIGEIPEEILRKCDAIFDAGKLKKTKPSTIYDPETGKVLRNGPVSEKKIREALR